MAANRPFIATIRASHIDEINVRSGPGTNFDVAFNAKDGQGNLSVRDVQPDAEEKARDGKTYQWFQLQFSENRTGWVRDDLLMIEGDGTAFGYGFLAGKVYAFAVTRAMPRNRNLSTVVANAARPPQPTPTPVPTPPTVETATQERIIRAAFNVTAAFEGTGYGSYQTYDQGIISYGRFQFTLQSGSLAAVINRFIDISTGLTAKALKKDYQQRFNTRDVSLRDDERLQAILLHAAREPEMQAAQDQIAYENYWRVVYRLSLEPRAVKTPLGQAMCFDIGIQHGTRHEMFARAERELGVPSKSRLGENGITEAEFIYRVALIRQEILYVIANQQNLPGVRSRADFWLEVIRAKDWNLNGDKDGYITVLGRKVQIKKP